MRLIIGKTLPVILAFMFAATVGASGVASMGVGRSQSLNTADAYFQAKLDDAFSGRDSELKPFMSTINRYSVELIEQPNTFKFTYKLLPPAGMDINGGAMIIVDKRSGQVIHFEGYR